MTLLLVVELIQNLHPQPVEVGLNSKLYLEITFFSDGSVPWPQCSHPCLTITLNPYESIQGSHAPSDICTVIIRHRMY